MKHQAHTPSKEDQISTFSFCRFCSFLLLLFFFIRDIKDKNASQPPGDRRGISFSLFLFSFLFFKIVSR